MTSRSRWRASTQAQAQLGSTRLNYLPQLSVQAGAARAKSSEYALVPGAPRINNEAQVQFLASYQLDLWGQLRRMNEAARANLLQSQYRRARSERYPGGERRQRLFRADLARQSARDHAAHGGGAREIPGSDTCPARARLRNRARCSHRGSRSRRRARHGAGSERQIAQTEDQISVLLGVNPGPITRTHYGDTVPAAPPLPPAGLPAQLLERRPDIAQAEQGLVAANAEIGVAKAALFPNISLTGSNGSLSVPFNNLFTAPAAEWGVGVGLIQPLLSVQSNLYQVQLADARKREALAQYQKTVQGAFQDVADALIAYRKYGEQVREQTVQVDALRRARAIALARYRIGYASYFDVIQADRDLFAAELALAQAYANNLSALVHLYSALGGGWQQRPGS